MSKRKITAGITSVSLPVFVSDTSSTTGAGLSGLAYNTSGLTAEYRRQGQSAWATITLVAGTLGTYVAGGFVADGALGGSYEVCPPDAAFAVGARWVRKRFYGATNMLPVEMEIELDAVNYQSSTAFIASVPAVAGAVGSISNVTLPATVPSLAQIQAGLPTDTTITANVQSALTTQGLTSTRAAKMDNMDAAITSRSTFAGGAVASVTGNVGGSVASVTGNVGGSVTGAVGSVTGDVGGKVLGGGASAFVANGAQVSASVSGNVTVGGYATGQDPVTLLKADADFKALIADTNGQFAFTVPRVFPGNGTLTLKDKAGANTLATITLGFDANRNVISRTVA